MIFVDTWGFKAFVDRKEKKHLEVKQYFQDIWNRKEIFSTSDYVIDETITLISYKLDFDKLEKFITALDKSILTGHLKLLWVSREDFENAKKLKLKDRDKLDISFTDFTTAILMKKYEITDIATEDKHFMEIGMGFNVLFS